MRRRQSPPQDDEAEGGKLLLRAYKGLPKYQPLIKYLSEPGMKQLLQKAENYYIQDNDNEMHIVTDPLYFVIEEQQNAVDMTDKGHDSLAESVSDPAFFVLPDVGSQVAEIEKSDLSVAEKQEKNDSLMEDFSIKSERVHTVIQLLKAYAMFNKDVDYILVEKKVKIVDEQTGRIMEGRAGATGFHQAVEAKESVKVESATQDLSRLHSQNYFRISQAGRYEPVPLRRRRASSGPFTTGVVVIPTTRLLSEG